MNSKWCRYYQTGVWKFNSSWIIPLFEVITNCLVRRTENRYTKCKYLGVICIIISAKEMDTACFIELFKQSIIMVLKTNHKWEI